MAAKGQQTIHRTNSAHPTCFSASFIHLFSCCHRRRVCVSNDYVHVVVKYHAHSSKMRLLFIILICARLCEQEKQIPMLLFGHVPYITNKHCISG